MWEASWGIIAVIVVMFGIGLAASSGRARPEARKPRRDIKIAAPAGAATATNLNPVIDPNKPSVAIQQAARGISLDRPPEVPLKPEEKAAIRGV
jgi:hypothetical protein